MRRGGQILNSVLMALADELKPGISATQIAVSAKRHLLELGGRPAFFGYRGFPDIICISINDQIVHGIPKPSTIIEEGDLVSLDFGVLFEDLITDAARTYIVGKSKSGRDKILVETTQRALDQGLDQVKNGCRTGDIGWAVQSELEKNNLGVIRDLVGHGVGDQLHEDPNIANFGNKGTGAVLKSGMTVAIEPMATLGDYYVVVDGDGWTVRTRDGSRAAHFEDTVVVTENGYEILTR